MPKQCLEQKMRFDRLLQDVCSTARSAIDRTKAATPLASACSICLRAFTGDFSNLSKDRKKVASSA